MVSTTSAGQFHHNELDTDDAPYIVMFGDLDNDTLETFQHELTHYFVSHYAPNTPLWLTEGLATYYETLRQQAGSAHLGLPNARRWSGLLSAGVVPFPDLLAARRKEFYGDPHRALRDPRQRSQARQQKLDLDEALTHDANAPDVLYHLARWHQQHDQLDEAERLLKRALHSRPTEPRYLTGLLRVYADRMARSNRRQQAETAAEAVLARLLPLARSAGALNTIARFHAQAGRDDASTYFAKRAVATDPRCQPCRLTLAQQLFAGQQYAAAVRELERAINLLPHDSVPSPRILERLRDFRARAWAEFKKQLGERVHLALMAPGSAAMPSAAQASSCTVCLRIDTGGQLASSTVTRSSGNAALNQVVQASISELHGLVILEEQPQAGAMEKCLLLTQRRAQPWEITEQP